MLEAMLPFLRERFGNASSRGHAQGRAARDAVETSRAVVASALGARPEEVVFTSGATESDNTALLGIAEARRAHGDHVVTARTEHRAVLGPAEILERRGLRVTRLEVDRHGRIDPDDLEHAVTDRTLLVSLMAANNEVGTIHPLEEIGRICRSRGVPWHCDAVQALGKIPLDVERLGIDLVSLSAHKIHGPMGVGVLVVRGEAGVAPSPLIVGGGQEGGRRSGTHNVPGIVGFARAVEIALASLEDESRRLGALRDRLLEILRSELPGVEVNGHPSLRLPNNLHVSFEGIDGEALLADLPDVALSTGSACLSEGRESSHVLHALGLDPSRVRGSVRFGLGRFTTAEEIDYAAHRVAESVRRLRSLGPAPPG